jgi:hypothetical protein
MFWRVSLVLALSFVTGCSRDQEVSAFCVRSPELESSLVAVNSALGELGTASSVVLQSSFAVLLDTLSVMLELPPREARGDLEKIERAYRETSVALRSVYWDTTLAASDTNVMLSVANLTRTDNVKALSGLQNLVGRLCRGEIETAAPLVAGDATTLPAPVIVVEPLEEYAYVFDDEPSAMQSYGFLIANTRSQTVTVAQAECVGKTVTEAAQIMVIDDDQFDTVVDLAFRGCGVTGFGQSTPTTTSE